MNTSATPLSSEAFSHLKPSPRMPVVYISHGSPMNAITPNEFSPQWEAFGQTFGDHAGARWPLPQLVLCISAHWLTEGWWLTGAERPRTIHDFGGFPKELFQQQYPAPGAPQQAQDLAAALQDPATGEPVKVDADEWGFDHGNWSVMKFLFPKANVPVIQLSMDYGRPPVEHWAMGRQLRALREQGVLIMGSGALVHNLRAIQMNAKTHEAYDWAIEFDQHMTDLIDAGKLRELADFQQLGDVARLAHPTYEHFLPLLHAAGAVHDGEAASYLNTGFQAASLSMRSVVWGEAAASGV